MAVNRCLVVPVVVVVLAASWGCATIVNGRSQDVRVFSTPAGAALWVNGRAAGTTPTTIRIRRAATVDLRMEMPGHAVTTVRIPRSVSGWIMGNGIVLNPFAAQGMNSVSQWATTAFAWFAGLMTVDRLSGGTFVRPRFVEATLQPLTCPPAGGTPADRASSCR